MLNFTKYVECRMDWAFGLCQVRFVGGDKSLLISVHKIQYNILFATKEHAVVE